MAFECHRCGKNIIEYGLCAPCEKIVNDSKANYEPVISDEIIEKYAIKSDQADD